MQALHSAPPHRDLASACRMGALAAALAGTRGLTMGGAVSDGGGRSLLQGRATATADAADASGGKCGGGGGDDVNRLVRRRSDDVTVGMHSSSSGAAAATGVRAIALTGDTTLSTSSISSLLPAMVEVDQASATDQLYMQCVVGVHGQGEMRSGAWQRHGSKAGLLQGGAPWGPAAGDPAGGAAAAGAVRVEDVIGGIPDAW